MKIFNDMLIHLEDLINKAEEGAPTSEGIKIPPRYLQLPPAEENGKGRYVLQAHWRGRSVHWDLRLELPLFLIGYTILDNPKIEEAPTEQNVKSVMENLDFKFKPIPGMEGKKCRIAEKARQPKDWLLWKEEYGECGLIKFDELYKQDIGVLYTVEETTEFSDLVEADLQKYIKQIGSRWCVVRHSPPHEIIHCYSGTGAHDKARKLLGAIQASKHRRMMAKMSTGTVYSVEPGGVGATRFKPGVLFIADKGKVTFGAQKVWYNEYFLESESKGGKFSFNKLRVNVRGVRQPVMQFPERKITPGKYEIVWDIWVPEDQNPYAVSSRAMKHEVWYPPKNFIPIPKYWIEDNQEKFDKWMEWVKTKWYTHKSIEKAEGEYCLHQMSWKGQVVIRDIPITHYYFSLKSGEKIRHWELRENPLRSEPSIATYHGTLPEKYFQKDTTLQPGELWNTNKRLIAKWNTLAQGQAYIDVERVQNEERVNLTLGGELKGSWSMNQEDSNAPIYIFAKNEAQKAARHFVIYKVKDRFHTEVELDSKIMNIVSDKDPRKLGLEESTSAMCYFTFADHSHPSNVLERGSAEIIELTDKFKSLKMHSHDMDFYYVIKDDRLIHSRLISDKSLKENDERYMEGTYWDS